MERTVDEALVRRLHLGLALASVLCTAGFGFELWRALAGNLLSWCYVFEWPLLLGFSVHMWRRMVTEERGGSARPAPSHDPEDEAALVAWRRHVAELEAREAARGLDV